MWKTVSIASALALGAALAAHGVFAQGHPAPPAPAPARPPAASHGAMHGHRDPAPGAGPISPGQDAFGAIAEVVRILDADPATDWSKVDLERLRQHLIVMNEVVLRSQVVQAPVPGGLAMEITGAGATEQAIRAMIVPHAAELDRLAGYAARAESIPGGVRLTVTAKGPEDARAVARIRGLGFAGLLTAGGHHGPHHLAMARGEPLAHRH